MDKFTKAYIECALWSSVDDNGEPLDGTYSLVDLCPATLTEMISDCEAFQKDNASDISFGTPEQAGHDFWLTRNRHGVEFWDGDWTPEAGARLTKAAHIYGEYKLIVGNDGMIYGGS